jgi:hypothetical protein
MEEREAVSGTSFLSVVLSVEIFTVSNEAKAAVSRYSPEPGVFVDISAAGNENTTSVSRYSREPGVFADISAAGNENTTSVSKCLLVSAMSFVVVAAVRNEVKGALASAISAVCGGVSCGAIGAGMTARMDISMVS